MSTTRLVTLSELNNIRQINGIYRINNVEELQQVIAHALKHHRTVRTLGSQHSPAASIYSNKRNEIKIKLEGDLTKITSFEEDKETDTALVRVGAGCHLGRDPKDPNSTLQNSFNYQVYQKGYSLDTFGGITEQVFGGLGATSGGTAMHAIAEAIEEIEYVDGNNTYKKVKKGEEEFNAVGVSNGLLGVITYLTLRLQRKYFVKGSEINQEVKDSCLAGDSTTDYAALDKALFEENEYIHINLFAQKFVNRISLWTGRQSTDVESPQVPYKHALNADSIYLKERLQGQLTRLAGAAILFITNVLNEKCGQYDFIQHLISYCIKPFVSLTDRQDFNGPGHEILPIDDQAPVHGMIKTTFCELWFPREKLNEAMRTLKRILADKPTAAGNFIIELYPAKKSPFMLSPSEGHDSFRIDLYFWDGNVFGTPKQYFGLFKDLWRITGCRFHPGKWMPTPGETYDGYTFTADDYQRNYPQFERFKEIREQSDPSQIFMTDYWRSYLSLEAKEEYKDEYEETSTLFSHRQRLLPNKGVKDTAYASLSFTR